MFFFYYWFSLFVKLLKEFYIKHFDFVNLMRASLADTLENQLFFANHHSNEPGVNIPYSYRNNFIIFFDMI